MNSYRMFTNNVKGLSDNFEIPQSLINEVLKMPDVYYINKQELRINASTLALVPGQLFYVQAEGSNGGVKVFSSTTECAELFNTSRSNINLLLASGKPIFCKSDNSEYVLYRKAI